MPVMSRKPTSTPNHLSNPKVVAVQDALSNWDPFCGGIRTVPNHQRVLYYNDGDTLHCIDFSNVEMDGLENLYHACKPAEFGRNGENVLDESYRKAGKMDLSSFSTLFDPHGLGIYDSVFRTLLTERDGTTGMEMELYKLNVYGPGDFFKAHQDTPRSKEMFGSLVVVLPTKHMGGQLVLHHEGKEWTIDCADQFSAATETSVVFVAFFGDIEHEVLPVTSGYRVTLTYNLYRKPSRITSAPRILSTFHQNLRQALVEVLNEPSNLPNGGYLGFGLAHQYVYTGTEPASSLLDQLKGIDRALVNVCDQLGLRYRLKLLYSDLAEPGGGIHLITDQKLPYREIEMDADERLYLELALQSGQLTIEQVECIRLVGFDFQFDMDLSESNPDWGEFEFLRRFYRKPVTEVIEITPMKSSMGVETPFLAYGNNASLEFFYGTACFLVAVDPAEVRVHLPGRH